MTYNVLSGMLNTTVSYSFCLILTKLSTHHLCKNFDLKIFGEFLKYFTFGLFFAVAAGELSAAVVTSQAKYFMAL